MKKVVLFVVLFGSASVQGRSYFSVEKVNAENALPAVSDNELTLQKDSENNCSYVGGIEDVSFRLYTRANRYDAVIIEAADFNGSMGEHFEPDKKIVFVTHGWMQGADEHTCRTIKDAVLAADDANVIVIDWRRPAKEFYTIARKSVPILGRIVADCINELISLHALTSDGILMVGQSLGAHLLGIASERLTQRAAVIVGLDPAQPLFYLDEPGDRLSIDDAHFVQVLHTNAGLLGFGSSIGHADYYPNGGGMAQPGCGPDITGGCAHGRSSDYYVESLLTSGFKGRKCESYEEYKDGHCDDNDVSYFGEYSVDKTANGDYYFDTNSEAPFAQN